MWNYSFMFPSVMVLFTILFFYFTRPRLSIRINRTYLGMLVLEILIILFDILSSWRMKTMKGSRRGRCMR